MGELALRRDLFALRLLNFSSSSDVTSESLLLRSTLIAPELRLEVAPKEGARLRVWGGLCAGVQYDSVLLIRWSRGSTG